MQPAQWSRFRIWAPPASPARQWNGFTRRHRIEIDLAKVPQRRPHDALRNHGSASRRSACSGSKKVASRKSWPSSRSGLDAVVVGHVTEGGIAASTTMAESPRKFRTSARRRRARISSPHRRTCATRRYGRKMVRVCSGRHEYYGEFPEAAGLARDRLEALDHRAVRHQRAHEHSGWPRRERCGGRSHQGSKDGVVKRALALSTDGNGRWCQLNPRVGAMHALADSSAHVACSGARPIAATNCLNFGSPEKPEVMCNSAKPSTASPKPARPRHAITGANVSFYNETLANPFNPTPSSEFLAFSTTLLASSRLPSARKRRHRSD